MPVSTKTRFMLLSEIIFWNIYINALLRIYGFSKLLKIVTPNKTQYNVSQEHIQSIVGYVDLIQRCANIFLKKTCLKRSLLLYHFLHKYNYDVAIHIGVKKDDSNVAAHSWLTYQGQLFADSEENVKEFIPILNYP